MDFIFGQCGGGKCIEFGIAENDFNINFFLLRLQTWFIVLFRVIGVVFIYNCVVTKRGSKDMEAFV